MQYCEMGRNYMNDRNEITGLNTLSQPWNQVGSRALSTEDLTAVRAKMIREWGTPKPEPHLYVPANWQESEYWRAAVGFWTNDRSLISDRYLEAINHVVHEMLMG